MDFLRKRKIAAAEKKEAAERRKWLLKKGRLMLEEMISSFNGKSNPIRSFSAPVILKATNNFDPTLTLSREDQYEWYKGIIEELPVLVKRSWSWLVGEDEMDRISRDIAVSSQMSSHKNVLKLLGCCLEFPSPVLVYEYAEKGPLNDRHGGLATGETLPWNIRLKIAKETASAIAYLHTAFQTRMVHRDIKPSKILLDEKWTAKISDFSDSILIPDGEPHVETDTIGGTVGFLAPDYLLNLSVNESIDVFGLGTILLILITGKPSIYSYGNEGLPDHLKVFVADPRENGPLSEVLDSITDPLNGYWMDDNTVQLKDLVANANEKCRLIEILDPRLVEDAVAEEALELHQMQWKAFIEVALRCTSETREDRPEMVEVAKELLRIEKLTKLSDMHLDKQNENVAPPVESSEIIHSA